MDKLAQIYLRDNLNLWST